MERRGRKRIGAIIALITDTLGATVPLRSIDQAIARVTCANAKKAGEPLASFVAYSQRQVIYIFLISGIISTGAS